MAKKETMTYDDVVASVKNGNALPIYCLEGEEAYYIDKLENFLVNSLLKEEEKDFNLYTFFGADTDGFAVANAAKTFPIGAKNVVVVVKEAQKLDNLDALGDYLKKPQPSTIIVLCYKGGKLDRRKKVSVAIKKFGMFFESVKMRDNNLATFITDYLKSKEVKVDQATAVMIAELVGADLNRMVGELDKLIISMPRGCNMISQELVRQVTANSREYTMFDLQNAIVKKDVLKANKIVNYFDENSKSHPLPPMLAFLFNFFSNVMLAFYAPDKSPFAISAWLEVARWTAENSIIPATKVYNGVKVMQILDMIRTTDAKSKGVENPSTSDGELMRQLIFFILH